MAECVEEDEYVEMALALQWEKKKKKKKAGKTPQEELQEKLLGKKVDLYEILEIGHLGFNAGPDDIKKAYRRLALKYHPDKHDSKDTSNPMFLLISNAYETLSDPDKRRAYDSQVDFDDSIPDGTEPVSQFYEVFGPVFQRNAKWTLIHPVPLLGDDNTPIEKVHGFYDFWYDFQSWRDFPQYDEYDPNDAETREEKRWMEKQNQKLRAPHKKAEKTRLRKLVELAEKKDPRLARERLEQRLAKLKAKQAKADAIAKTKAEERERELQAQREEEERKQQEIEKSKELKKERDRENKAMKKERQRFRTAMRERSSDVSEDQVELLCSSLNRLALEQLTASVVNGELDAVSRAVEEVMKKNEEEQSALQRQRIEKEKEEEQRKRDAKPPAEWSVEELSLLAKGLVKYPGGLGRRWQLVSQFIGTKSQEEVIAKAKEMAQGQTLASMGSSISNSTNFILPPSKEINSAPSAAVPAAVPATSTPSPAPSKTPATRAAAASKANTAEATNKTAAQTTTPTTPPTSTAAAAGSKASAPVAEVGEVWTKDQQEALEKALAKHPATIPAAERWTLIAADVPGKNKKQCVARFKELREAIMAKKQTA